MARWWSRPDGENIEHEIKVEKVSVLGGMMNKTGTGSVSRTVRFFLYCTDIFVLLDTPKMIHHLEDQVNHMHRNTS